MSDEHEQMINRMAVAKMVRDRWEADPPDVEEWARALEGCSQLYALAAEHLRSDPPRHVEAARCVAVATKSGADLHPQIVLAYAMSGQAMDDFMGKVRDDLARHNGEATP